MVVTSAGEGAYTFSVGNPQNVAAANWNFGDSQNRDRVPLCSIPMQPMGIIRLPWCFYGQCDDSITLTQTVKVENITGIDNLAANEQLVFTS